MPAATIRAGRDADGRGIIALIGGCWAEYPDIVLDIDGEMPELRALATYYRRQGGSLWVAEMDTDIVGMIAACPHGDGVWEICRVYVRNNLHGAGLAHRLLDIAEAHAATAGALKLELWTDTRFCRAHRFYEKRGYTRAAATRALHDRSNSIEFHYAKAIAAPERAVLDAPAGACRKRS